MTGAGPRPARANRLTTVAWGGVGFIVGAAFWHFIGFWGFVSDVVLKGHPDDARQIAQAGNNCLELTLDRATSKVAAIPCPLFASELAESRGSRRSDSLKVADKRQERSSRWSILISQEDETPAPAPPGADLSADTYGSTRP